MREPALVTRHLKWPIKGVQFKTIIVNMRIRTSYVIFIIVVICMLLNASFMLGIHLERMRGEARSDCLVLENTIKVMIMPPEGDFIRHYNERIYYGVLSAQKTIDEWWVDDQTKHDLVQYILLCKSFYESRKQPMFPKSSGVVEGEEKAIISIFERYEGQPSERFDAFLKLKRLGESSR